MGLATRVCTVALACSILMVTAQSGARSKRSFLMLNDQSIDFVDGVPVLGRWPVVYRWDAKEQRSIETVDGIDFVIGKKFWKMVAENTATKSAKSEVRLEKDGRLLYKDNSVDLGLGVRYVDSALRWRDWIVAVGTSTDATRSTIKGAIWYLFWFNAKNLKGSFLQASAVGVPPLRIYSEQE
jgi:hypothetical protein